MRMLKLVSKSAAPSKHFFCLKSFGVCDTEQWPAPQLGKTTIFLVHQSSKYTSLYKGLYIGTYLPSRPCLGTVIDLCALS